MSVHSSVGQPSGTTWLSGPCRAEVKGSTKPHSPLENPRAHPGGRIHFFGRWRTAVLLSLLAATYRPVSVPSISSPFLLACPDPPGNLESLFCFRPLSSLPSARENSLLSKGLMRLDRVHLENLLIIKSTAS